MASDNNFNLIDLGGGNPTSVPTDTLHVKVSTDNLFGQYAKAWLAEAYRVAPNRADQVQLTDDELHDYIVYLVKQRIDMIHGERRQPGRLRTLYVPAFISYVMRQIGIVNIREFGLRLDPVMEEDVKFSDEDALRISEKVGSFEDDLQVEQNVFPFDPSGDKDVMSLALIDGYVRGFKHVEHPVSTYISAFLGMKLREESAFSALYRVQYDDVAFIQSAFFNSKGLY